MTLLERTIAPSPALRPYLSFLRVITTRARAELAWLRSPEVSTALVYCGSWSGDGRLLAVGPSSRASFVSKAPEPLYVRAELRPGAARALLGLPLHELGDRVVSLDELWGEREVRSGRARGEDGGVEGAVAALEAMLLARFEREAAPVAAHVRLLDAATRLIAGGEVAPESVPRLARRVGVSERQLRRLFHDEVGVSPKRFARIARIRRVLARVGTASWAQIAAEQGFFDQAHLSGEFHALVGCSPRAFFRQGLQGARRCGAG